MLFVLMAVNFINCEVNKVVFQFPEYDYKETSKNVSDLIGMFMAL
jgi:hypothetical protein